MVFEVRATLQPDLQADHVGTKQEFVLHMEYCMVELRNLDQLVVYKICTEGLSKQEINKISKVGPVNYG